MFQKQGKEIIEREPQVIQISPASDTDHNKVAQYGEKWDEVRNTAEKWKLQKGTKWKKEVTELILETDRKN